MFVSIKILLRDGRPVKKPSAREGEFRLEDGIATLRHHGKDMKLEPRMRVVKFEVRDTDILIGGLVARQEDADPADGLLSSKFIAYQEWLITPLFHSAYARKNRDGP